VKQLRQTLAAEKLSLGFFLGAGCPCSVRVPGEKAGTDRPLIPDIKGLTVDVNESISASKDHGEKYKKLISVLGEDGDSAPTIETMLNCLRSLREVASKVAVRGLSFDELDSLDREICHAIKEKVTCDLPSKVTPYHALARFVGTHPYPIPELFTTNYDALMEQALEVCRVPHFDGFVGSSHPFFDQRAIEDDKIPIRWCRLWKLHGSINWRFNKETKSVFRSIDDSAGGELLIHPSHRKYDESRRMPYFVMIDRLRAFFRNNQKPAALVVIGYSFRDEHLNEVISEGLKVNGSAVCFALQFGELSEYPIARKLAEENVNLWVLAKDCAVIRRRTGNWMAHAATDYAAIKPAFERVEPKENGGKPPEDTDEPYQCRLTIGDFRLLGEFLDEFSGPGTFGGVGSGE
jgi:hypothetical protein